MSDHRTATKIAAVVARIQEYLAETAGTWREEDGQFRDDVVSLLLLSGLSEPEVTALQGDRREVRDAEVEAGPLSGRGDPSPLSGSLIPDGVGRSPEGPPAHTSGREPPDSIPSCPRCAALEEQITREIGARDYHRRMRDEARRDLAQARQALHRLRWAATTVWHQASIYTGTVKLEALDELLEALSVARKALVEPREACSQCGGPVTEVQIYAEAGACATGVCATHGTQPLAREALVERGTDQTDTGGDETSPVAEEDRP